MIDADDPRNDHPLNHYVDHDEYVDYDPWLEIEAERARSDEDDLIAHYEEEAREREARDAEIARQGVHMGKTNLGQLMREALFRSVGQLS